MFSTTDPYFTRMVSRTIDVYTTAPRASTYDAVDGDYSLVTSGASLRFGGVPFTEVDTVYFGGVERPVDPTRQHAGAYTCINRSVNRAPACR